MRREWNLVGLVSVACIGCGTPESPVPQLPPAGTGMPTLERRPFEVAEADRPDAYYFMFDVAADGQVVFVDEVRESKNVMVLDSTGRRVRAFGGNGEGPGETREVWELNIHGDTIKIYGMGLIKRALSGTLLDDTRFFAPELSMSYPGDSVDHWEPMPTVDSPTDDRAVYRALLGQSGGRRLVGVEDSVFAAAAKPSRFGVSPLSIPYTSTLDRLFVGDGWAYRIRVFDAMGSHLFTLQPNLPPNVMGPRELRITRDQLATRPKFIPGPDGRAIPLRDATPRLDTLERESTRHFTRNPLHIDEHGRLWVIGLTRDSTSVDIWADSTWLGRALLPCYGARPGTRAALGPGWLLLECEVDDGDWPTELQLYRVIERE